METPNSFLVLGLAVDRVVRRLIAMFLLVSAAPLLLEVDDPRQSAATGAATFLLAFMPIGLALLWRRFTWAENPNVSVLATMLGVSEVVTVLVLAAGALATIVTGSVLPYAMVTLSAWTVMGSLAFGTRRMVRRSLQ